MKKLELRKIRKTMGEYIVRLVDMPCSVNGVTVLDEDGFANIYINSRLSHDQQQEAIQHELRHIHRDDFYKLDEPLEAVERM